MHRQLDDDDNGDIDLSESDDVRFSCDPINALHSQLLFILVSARGVKVRRRLREASSGVPL